MTHAEAARASAAPDASLGDVAVVGGGIGGLAAAHRLIGEGARVSLFEASDQLGGLGTFFQYGDSYLEKFYHCMLPSDEHLLPLLRSVGIADDVYWKVTSFGFMRDGIIYPLNTPVDLLKFGPLPFVDRLRVGVTGLWGRMCSDRGLDEMTCQEWLTRLSGRRAFETFWKPMLQAKFGDRYHDIPALWFWTRFNREKGSGPERKGYIRGGYKRIVDAVSGAVTSAGGRIHMNAPVERLDLGDDGRPVLTVRGAPPRAYDRVLITAPVLFLQGATKGGRLEQVAATAASGLDMQGVINGIFMLRRSLTKHYWVAALDEGIPFQGVVESTTLVEPDDAAGVHLVYVMNYVHRSEPIFATPDDAMLDSYQQGLMRLFPELRADDIIDRFIFRSPFVEPLYTRGYNARKPPLELVPGRVYLATTTQVYPDVTSWNGATGLVNRVVDAMVSTRR